jgi:hypothetical protein
MAPDHQHAKSRLDQSRGDLPMSPADIDQSGAGREVPQKVEDNARLNPEKPGADFSGESFGVVV